MFNICTDTFCAFSDMFATSCYFRCSSIFDSRSGMFNIFMDTFSALVAGRSCMFNICTDTFSAFSDMFATSCYFRCSSIFDGRSGMFNIFMDTFSALVAGRSCMFHICTDTFFSAFSDMFATSCYFRCPSIFDGRSGMFVHLRPGSGLASGRYDRQGPTSNSVQRSHDRFC